MDGLVTMVFYSCRYLMIIASASQFHVYLPWVNTCLACLKCEIASRNFLPREGPSRGLLRDCEIFANLCLKLYFSDSRDQCGSPALEKTGTMTNAKVQTQN